MAIESIRGQRLGVWIFFCLELFVVNHLEGTSGQIRHSIQEESKLGTSVGNVAKDLGLDLGRLAERNLRVVSGSKQDLFKVNSFCIHSALMVLLKVWRRFPAMWTQDTW
uniref:Cadherin N-terminal domain-containing protein n=1 Tax=Cynoglossus semilaevis TaxID=244447 RepID=A0A3P8VBV3_CYNSE